jgi:colanic acid/amylovoran biosynthesis glycosyltransferase
MHLLEVSVRWPPETFLCWKLEGLAARGMRVTVASKAVFDGDARLEGVELVRIAPRGEPLGRALRIVARDGLALLARSPLRLVRLWRGARRHVPPGLRERYGGMTGLMAMYLRLARMRPDVVHFEWNTAAADYLPLFDVWDCPVVTSCHGSDVSIYPHVPGQERYAERLAEVFARAGAVHCVSASLRREAEQLGLDPAKAHVIHPGVDPAAFRPDAKRPAGGGELRVIAVGWLRWMKGHEYALAAARAAVDRGVPLRLDIIGGAPDASVGEPGERRRILHTIADLGLEQHVHLHGTLTSAQVVERLQTADVMLHASLSEGLPTVLLEAMACGLPVVTTDCGGVTEAVTDGAEGFVVPARDADALAQALAALWRDPALRARMGAAGRATVQERFTLERQLGEFLALYEATAAA